MPIKDVLISQKFNNFNYAPGIATYGIDGKTGQAGLDGNNIYFTNCNIISDNDESDIEILAALIRKNVLPVKGSTEKINRKYKNGDLFFDINGIIFKLINIDALLGASEVGSYTNYFSIAGKITVENAKVFANGIENINNRLIFNSSDYSGYDIIKGVAPEVGAEYIDTDAAVNIISNVVNANDNIEMVKMQSIDDVDVEDGKLSVYYKTTENAYYLESNKPIVINSDVKLNTKNNTNNEYDNFSTVLTSTDTITYFKHICDKLRYNILYDSDTNRYKLVIYQEDGGRDDLEYLINRSETVYGKVYTDSNEQILIQLSDIITGSVDSSKYYDHGDFKYLNIPTSAVKNSIRVYGIAENNTIFDEDISISKMHVALDNDQHIIDISIDTVYPINNIIIESGDNISQHFIINDSEEYKKYNGIIYGNSSIAINICPNEYELLDASTHFPFVTYPIKIQLETDTTLNTTFNYIYFEAKKPLQDGESLLSIRNIGISRYLYTYNNTTPWPCIETYLPDSVESVQRFSLLHNTEVFINYQE